MTLPRPLLWLRSLLLKRRLDREMQEEMREHLRRATDRLIARGLTPADAQQQARREFGNVSVLQDAGRDARGAGWVDALASDAQFAIRHYTRTPFTTSTMFVVLATGIAISALLFSAMHSLAVQPPSAVTRSDDLVRIRGTRGSGVPDERQLREEELREYRALAGQFRAVAAWTNSRHSLVLPGDAERRTLDASVTFVTENYFTVLGVRPVLGRGFATLDARDAASAGVAVIAHATWTGLFARDAGVIGTTVMVEGVPVTIVGVAPERFYGVDQNRNAIQLWMPLAAQRNLLQEQHVLFSAAARLGPGTTLAAATAAVRPVAERVIVAEAERPVNPSADVVPLLAMNGDPGFQHHIVHMYVLVGVLALLILLVTCTNVSALLMGLAMARKQEITIRLALGAARARLLRQLLTESVLISGIAAAAALGLVWLVLRVATSTIPDLPFELGLTWPAMTFTFGVALATGVLFGLAPALHGTRVALSGALSDSSVSVAGRRGGVQRGLVVAQITLTQPLIVLLATVLLAVLREMTPYHETEFGDRLIRAQIRPKVRSFDRTAASDSARRELSAIMRRLTERLGSLPGAERAVIEWSGQTRIGFYGVHASDGSGTGRVAGVGLMAERAASGYFAAMGIPIVRGRDFDATQVATAGPRTGDVDVIVGADLAQRMWGGADPIGRRLVAMSDTTPGARTLTVVGVIDDPLSRYREADEGYRVYLPPDTTQVAVTVLLRTRGAALSLMPQVQSVIDAETAGMRADVRTIAEMQHEAERFKQMAATGVAAAGVSALFLSAIGLYAVVAFAVGQRKREIAVRMALGAPPSRIVSRVIADGVRLGAIGLAIGLPFSIAGIRMLFATDADFPALPMGPVTSIAAFGVLATALVAAWLPAREAANVDPAVTLRAE